MNKIQDDEEVTIAETASWPVKRLSTLFGALLTIASLAYALDLYRKVGLIFLNEQLLVAVLGVGLAALYLMKPARIGSKRLSVPWYDWIAVILSLVACFYVAINYENILDRLYLRPPEVVVLATVIVVLVLEGLRRTTGHFLFFFLLIFIALGFFGYLIPGQLQGQRVPVDRLLLYLGIDSNSILGAPLRVVTTVVIPFIYFGNLLDRSSGSQFFTEIASALMGRYRGGSAKIAVVASSLFGTVSGSAVSNVVSVGTVTIPLMQRAGYKPHQAAAIEAVASTGGQIMPPMMGAAAFLVAEFLERPYTDIVLAAAVPAVLYYASLFIQADLIAARDKLAPVEASLIPKAGPVLRTGWLYAIPFVVIIVGLFRFNLEPETAAVWAIGSLLPVGLLIGYKNYRMHWSDIFSALGHTGVVVVQLLMISAMAGIVIGVLNITGLGFALTEAVVLFAGGNKLIILALAAIISVVLGMGMPTVGVYLLLATIVIPSMVESGIQPLSAHMFAFYFGILSMITPPVAVAAFAAATLANCDFMKTGWSAVAFSWPAYVVPFLFVLSPQLLMEGDPAMIVLASVTAVAGVWLVSIGGVGYFAGPLRWGYRALFAIAGIGVLLPANAFPHAIWTDVAGTIVAVAVIATRVGLRRRLIGHA